MACACRKPAPGMFLAAAAELNIDLASSFMIGDRTADLAAGAARRLQDDPGPHRLRRPRRQASLPARFRFRRSCRGSPPFDRASRDGRMSMIGTRTPFRISFAGGGSDLRSFYSRQPGCVVSTSINKYMYILIHPYLRPQDPGQVFAGRAGRSCRRRSSIPSSAIALGRFGIEGVDINSIADIPAGTGLGSSCSFTVGLLQRAVRLHRANSPPRSCSPSDACDIEIEILGEPIGKQDIYAAAYGGLNLITFYPDETVQVEPVIMPRGQRANLTEEPADVLSRLHALGRQTFSASSRATCKATNRNSPPWCGWPTWPGNSARRWSKGAIDDMGPILDENWHLKKTFSGQISNARIDAYYEKAKQHGASGGKLLGAGGSGFLLLYCTPENQDRLRHALADLRNWNSPSTVSAPR